MSKLRDGEVQFRLGARANGPVIWMDHNLRVADGSPVWLAAMHAGLLQSGQSKVVGVTILGPQANFTGSRRNNITSGDWTNYPGGFRFKTGRANGPAARAQAMPGAQAMPAPNAPQFNPGFVQPGFAP